MPQLRRVILIMSLAVAVGGAAWFVIWAWCLNHSDEIAAASLVISAGSLLVGLGARLFPISDGNQPPKQVISGKQSIGIAIGNDVVITGDGNVVEPGSDRPKDPGITVPPPGGVRVEGDGSIGYAADNDVVIIGDHNVVLWIDEQDFSTVPIPASRQEAERLLFGSTPSAGSALVGSWLRPNAGVITPQPRPEQDAIVAWLRSEAGPVVRLVCGAGGQGKTFLAHQVCRTMQAEGWSAGFVGMPPLTWRSLRLTDLPTGPGVAGLRRALKRVPQINAAIHAIPTVGGLWLLVIDYAENTGPLVGELLETIVDAGVSDRVRVLLLARTAEDWWRELSEEHRLHDLIDPIPIQLSSLTEKLSPQQVEQVWREAVRAFAFRARQHHYPVGDVNTDTPPKSAETTLDLYADALLRVLDSTGNSTVGVADGDPIARVRVHEMRQVSSRLHADGLRLSPNQRDWAIAAVALRPAFSLEDAAAVLENVHTLQTLAPAERGKLAQALVELYPDDSGEQVWAAPRPDRLIDTHLITLADQAVSLHEWLTNITTLAGTHTRDIAIQAAIVLYRCLSTPGPQRGKDRIRTALEQLIISYPAGYVPALTLVAPEEFTEIIVTAINDDRYDINDLIQFNKLLLRLGFATTRAHIAAAISQRLEAATRPGPDATEEQRARHALELNNLSVRLAEVGRPHEALAAIEEAVTIRRNLTQTNPDTHLPDLAASLNNLSNYLADAGRQQEALTAIEEAVTIRRNLAQTNPAYYLPKLAASLNNLSSRLSAVGRRQEALAAIEEAVTIYRDLAQTNPTAHLPNLALTLNNLSVRLAEVGRPHEALAAIEEAVTIRRNLTQTNPDTHLPDLALSLNNLSSRLSAVGRRQEALAATAEAVITYHRLATDNPAYLPNLAAALNNLSIDLAAVGRRQEAHIAGQGAVTTYRHLATDNPAYLPKLAAALNNLSVGLAGLNRRQEALAAIEEAVTIRRNLTQTNPDTHLPDLALSLNNLSSRLSAVGRRQEALAAIEEAVTIYRDLARVNPAIYLPHLLRSLVIFANLLDRIGDTSRAQTIREEATALQRELNM